MKWLIGAGVFTYLAFNYIDVLVRLIGMLVLGK